MIENVGFLDKTKNIVTDEDLEFKKASFAVAEDSVFKDVGDNFFCHNKYLGCFSGFLVMKACTLNARNTPIVKLPVTPLFREAILTGFIIDEPIMFVVDKDGNLTLNETKEISEDTYINVVGSFPISRGGVTLKGLLSKIKHFFHREEVLVC